MADEGLVAWRGGQRGNGRCGGRCGLGVLEAGVTHGVRGMMWRRVTAWRVGQGGVAGGETGDWRCLLTAACTL